MTWRPLFVFPNFSILAQCHKISLRATGYTLSEQAHENVVIYTHDTPLRQVWQWAVRLEDGRRRRHREHPFFSASPPETLIERLARLRFTLNEEEQVRLVDALERVRKVLDTTPDLNLFVKRPRYAEKGDQLAREMINGGQLEFERFIEFHRPLAAWAVKPLRGVYRMDIEDLEQIGIQGLIHAARHFDPDRGFQFATYATYCIRGYCNRLAPAQSHLIRVPPHVFWPCMKIRAKLQRLASNGPLAVRHELDRMKEVDPDVAQSWPAFQRAQTWKSLSDRSQPEYQEATTLIDPNPRPFEMAVRAEQIETVRAIIRKLPRRQAQVIRLRYGIEEPSLTLQQVGHLLEITRERVRQIQAVAELKLESYIRAEIPSLAREFVTDDVEQTDGEAEFATDQKAESEPMKTSR